MRKSFKRTLSLLLAVVMLCTVLAIAPFTVSAAEVVDSGSWDNSSYGSGTWTLDGEGVLTIEGTGVLPEYKYNERWEKEEYKSQIKKIIFGSGLTATAWEWQGGSFQNFYALEEIVFLGSFEISGRYQFNYCTNLKTIITYGKLEITQSLQGCSSLSDIYVYGVPRSITLSSFKKDYVGYEHLNVHYPEKYVDLVINYYNDITTVGDIENYDYSKDGYLITFYNHSKELVSYRFNEYGDTVTSPYSDINNFDYFNTYSNFSWSPALHNVDGDCRYDVIYGSVTPKYSTPTWTWEGNAKATATFKVNTGTQNQPNYTDYQVVATGDDIQKITENGYELYKATVSFPTDEIRNSFPDTDANHYAESFEYTNKNTATQTVVQPSILGYSTSLDSVIRLNVYVDTKGLNPTVDVSGSLTDYKVENLDNNIRKYVFNVNAKQLADTATIRLTGNDADQNAYDKSGTYSVKNYLETILQNPENYEPDEEKHTALKDICAATLNYGAAAQTQFGYKTDILANSNVETLYSDYTAAVPTADLAVDSGSQDNYSSLGLEYYASNMGLFADTSYAVCFTDKENQLTNNTVTCKVGDTSLVTGTVGTTHVVHDDKTEDYYDMVAVYIPGIAAKDLLEDISVDFYKDGSKVKTAVYNPQTYIAKVLAANENGQQATLANTVTKIYDYAVKAKAYFD